VRVAISAYACDPGSGSERGAGWAWASGAARAGHAVTLFTTPSAADRIRRQIGEDDLDIELRLIPAPHVPRLPGQVSVRARYARWQRRLRDHVLAAHRQRPFHVAHHLTWAADWMPVGIVGLPDLPSVLGPVGGAGHVPLPLWRWLGPRGIRQELLRLCFVEPLRITVGVRAASRASVLVAQNEVVARRFCRRANVIKVEPNIALDLPTVGVEGLGTGAPKAVFVGNLIPLKGGRLALDALRRASRWKLDFYGDGPELAELEKLVWTYGLHDRVSFRGRRSRVEALSALIESDALLLPSMHDAAGWAVGEALALGTPVVALNVAGTATVLREEGIEGVAPNRQAAESLAAHLNGIPVGTKRTPSTRWDESRIPALLDEWYTLAASGGNSLHGA
jgi:glycosyltransferase involved in cell wall biosynthesis